MTRDAAIELMDWIEVLDHTIPQHLQKYENMLRPLMDHPDVKNPPRFMVLVLHAMTRRRAGKASCHPSRKEAGGPHPHDACGPPHTFTRTMDMHRRHRTWNGRVCISNVP
jgi:hypothetical protein